MKTGCQWRESLDSTDPCWDLFSFKLILSEFRYLFRAFHFLKAAADAAFVPSSDFKELQSAVDAVKADLEEAKRVLSETIDMASPQKFRPENIDSQLCLHQRGSLCSSFWIQHGIPLSISSNISSHDFFYRKLSNPLLSLMVN